MLTDTDRVLQEALKLPDKEQLNLLSALWTAIDEKGLRPLDDEWLAEIRRRWADYEAGKVKMLSVEEFFEQVDREVFGGG